MDDFSVVVWPDEFTIVDNSDDWVLYTQTDTNFTLVFEAVGMNDAVIAIAARDAAIVAQHAAEAAAASGMSKPMYDPLLVEADAFERGNHHGTQSADTLTDGVVNKAFLATERTKLAGIAVGATANATDAQLRDRSTHTGTQLAATISNFSTAADARVSAAIGVTVQAYSAILAATTASYTVALDTKLGGIATGATANSTDAQLRDRSTHTGTQLAATISNFSTAADARVSAAIGVTVQAYSAILAATTASYTVALDTKLGGIAAGADVTVTALPVAIHGAASKAIPVDLDELALSDSAAAFGLKKLTIANLKELFRNFFYPANKAVLVDGDLFGVLDSAATYAPKYASGVNLKSYLKSYFDSFYIGVGLLTTRGDIITRGVAATQRLGLGAIGKVLQSNGTDALWLPTGWVTPEMYGAVGDGVADDTVPVQAAFTSGLNVYLASLYRITDTILVGTADQRTICGRGRGVRALVANMNKPYLKIDVTASIYWLTFHGFDINTTNAGVRTAEAGIQISGATALNQCFIKVHDIGFLGLYHCILIDKVGTVGGESGVSKCEFNNIYCDVGSNGLVPAYGIRATTSINNAILFSNMVLQFSIAGIAIGNGSIHTGDTLFNNIEFYGNGTVGSAGIRINGGTNYAYNIAITGCQFEGTTYSLDLTNVKGLTARAIAWGGGTTLNLVGCTGIDLDIPEVISPTQLTASQNNYAPVNVLNSTNWVRAGHLRIAQNAAWAITGLVAYGDARLISITNISAFELTLSDESASSTAANRFSFGGDLILPAGRTIQLKYDDVTQRWRCHGGNAFELRGTFTPALQATGSVFSYALQEGFWSKIGDIVYVEIAINLNTTGNTLTANVVTLIGLPFTVKTKLGGLRWPLGWAASTATLVNANAKPNTGTTVCDLYGITAAGVANNTSLLANQLLHATNGSQIRCGGTYKAAA